MDKLEYIPGDFVTIETVSTKPRVVKVSDVDKNSVIYCEGWGNVGYYDEIKPIPLTKDILLRNGWKVSRDSLLLKIDNNVTLGTMCDNENFIRIQIRHNTLAYKALKDMLAKYIIGKDDECEYHSTSYRVPKSEFEKEEL